MNSIRPAAGVVLVGILVAALAAVYTVGFAAVRHQPHRPHTVTRLMAAHGCWQHKAPADVQMPGHSVVTTPNGHVVYGGAWVTGLALDQQFNGVDHGLRVWGFCR